MGLFDYVICEYPLPDGFDASSLEWQTKSLDGCFMRKIFIRADGTLQIEEFDLEEVPEEERPYFNDPRFHESNSILKIAGCMKHTNIHLQDQTDFTGEFRFSGVNEDYTVAQKYVALFRNGKLISIDGGDDSANWQLARDMKAKRKAEEAAEEAIEPTISS